MKKGGERNKIMGMVSHKLKNQIHSIRVPIQNLIEMSNDSESNLAEHKQILMNIDKSAQYIYNLTNFSSQAMSTKVEDFVYDAINNKNGQSIEHIIVDSMLDAVPNMFDTKVYVKQLKLFLIQMELSSKAKKE